MAKVPNSNLGVDKMMIRCEAVATSDAVELIVYKSCLRTPSLKVQTRPVSLEKESALRRDAGIMITKLHRKRWRRSKTKKRQEKSFRTSISTSSSTLHTVDNVTLSL